MLRAIGLITVLALSAAALGATTRPTTLPAEYAAAADRLAAEFEKPLARSRYMESDEVRDVKVAGYAGLPTRRYTYSVKDKDGTLKRADVILLDPSAAQIARWIVDALVEVRGRYDEAEGRAVFKHVLGQSGGQFPVAGVVYEDIIPADGVNEVYCFRDGVTVEAEGVPHRHTAPLTAAQVEASISGDVKRVFTYARIQSTSPQQWIAGGGSSQVMKDGKPTMAWMAEIRAAYVSAWGSSRNELMVAYVRATSPGAATRPAK